MKRLLIILLVTIFSLILFSDYLFARDLKGVIALEVRENGQTIIRYKNSHALLIGISDYEYWPDLNNVPKEITLLEASLKKHGFRIQRSLNPTGEELRKTIRDFIDRYGFKENNRLLIFFSGHGYTGKEGKKGYIVPADAVEPLDDEMKFVQKAIEMEQIFAWARRIETNHALFVFDSCFSGTIFKARNLSTGVDISYLTGKPVRQFITSCSAGETVPVKSYFVPCFIRGIEGEADANNDGYIIATELGTYLRKKVLQYNTGQTPQFGKIKDPDPGPGGFCLYLEKTGNRLK